MPYPPGTRVDHYDVVSLIDAGGMGEVYLAHDTRLDRKVALKLLPQTLAADPDRLRRFMREAKTASTLNHPNILTVFDVGESEGQPFLATELVEGVTLRQRMTGHGLALEVSLDIAVQTASALAAAHAAGIVHRDAKPENIMIRPDGLVKVLDFGLAKLVEPPATPTAEARTSAMTATEPGVVFGTVRYMSPEQIRGTDVDTRSDIFSFGIVLYEMLTGRSPFTGDTPSDVIAAILTSEPAPLAGEVASVPHLLQRSLGKALRKDREERYQTMKDFLVDLKDVRQEMQLESRVARANIELPAAVASTGVRRGHEKDAVTPAARLAASIWAQKRMVAPIAAFVLVAVAFVSYFNRADALTDKDTILIVDFANTTGEPVFDGTLKQGLAVQLSQSPFLDIFPETRVQETLRQMGREPNTTVTREIGREIGQRQGLKAFVAGSIARFDRNYSIIVEAIGTQSGEAIARAQAEAEGKDQILRGLSQVATALRERLGESLGSIQKFDAPLEATTSSLEALKAYSFGIQETNRGRYRDAIPFLQRAVELDPNFAYAWGALAIQHYNVNEPVLAAQFAENAVRLSDRVSELEKLRIATFAAAFITGDLDETLETLGLYKHTYPRDSLPVTNLAAAYIVLGEFEKAEVEARAALSLNSARAGVHASLARALLGLGRIDEARETLKRAADQGFDSEGLRFVRYASSLLLHDHEALQRELDAARGRSDEHVVLDWQVQAMMLDGTRHRAEELRRRSIDIATQRGAKELAARYAADGSLSNAAFGDCKDVLSRTAESLEIERSPVPLGRSAIALSLCRKEEQASALADELKARYPKDTLVNSLWLPIIRAAVQVERGNAGRVIQELAAIRYEAVGEFWPSYLRGQAFLQQRAGADAAVEFRKILDNRGHAPLSPLYPLSQLGLARALALGEDMSVARKAYEDFFAMWNDADADVPILQAAKAEYARLGS